MVVASIKLNVAVHKATAIKNDDMINAKEKILSQTGNEAKDHERERGQGCGCEGGETG